jgi:hypothetical protein
MTILAATAAEMSGTLAALGETEEAARFAEDAVRRARGRGDHDLEAYAVLRLAEARRAQGREADARAEIVAARTIDGVSPHLRAHLLAFDAETSRDPAEAALRSAEASELANLLPSPWVRARALAAQGGSALRWGDSAGAALRLRQAAGLLLSAGRVEPLVHRVLRDLAAVLAALDPDAAAAAARRAYDVAKELRARGYAVSEAAAEAVSGRPDPGSARA